MTDPMFLVRIGKSQQMLYVRNSSTNPQKQTNRKWPAQTSPRCDPADNDSSESLVRINQILEKIRDEGRSALACKEKRITIEKRKAQAFENMLELLKRKMEE